MVAKHGCNAPNANRTLSRLIDLGNVREMTGYRRNRVFCHAEFLRTLNEGTEPL